MSPARARVFFALWPPQPVRGALESCAQAAQSECGGRAIAAANIHLTLFFVGAIERSRIAVLERAARTVHGGPFGLTLDRVGYFRHNRIVWAGASRCPPQLDTLEARLRSALVACGFAAETRPYSPHVTLVRKAARRPAQDTIAALAWPISEFALMESVPVAAGVRYEALAKWRL